MSPAIRTGAALAVDLWSSSFSLRQLKQIWFFAHYYIYYRCSGEQARRSLSLSSVLSHEEQWAHSMHKGNKKTWKLSMFYLYTLLIYIYLIKLVWFRVLSVTFLMWYMCFSVHPKYGVTLLPQQGALTTSIYPGRCPELYTAAPTGRKITICEYGCTITATKSTYFHHAAIYHHSKYRMNHKVMQHDESWQKHR